MTISQHDLGDQLHIVSRQWSLTAFRERHELLYGPGHLMPELWPEKNVHSDDAAAQREGLPEAVAAAPQIIAQVSRMMLAEFGVGWVQGGRISVKMIKPVFPSEFTVARGIVIGRELEIVNDVQRVRVVCRVGAETLEGKQVLVGTASALTNP
jgi:hypothetical protein